jgi:hypothetical protein
MKLCSYVVIHDIGFAPNPFWGYCTLAACTPNHMGIHLQKGDWIIGTESIKKGNKLIYAMQVSNVLHFDEYYSDPRFQKKKPIVNGDWSQRCGDNIYFRDATETWQQHRSLYHHESATIRKDLKHPYVFIAEHFYYFGNRAETIPLQYESLILKRQGVKCNHDSDVTESFIDWLQASFRPGIHGEPSDNPYRNRHH